MGRKGGKLIFCRFPQIHQIRALYLGLSVINNSLDLEMHSFKTLKFNNI